MHATKGVEARMWGEGRVRNTRTRIPPFRSRFVKITFGNHRLGEKKSEKADRGDHLFSELGGKLPNGRHGLRRFRAYLLKNQRLSGFFRLGTGKGESQPAKKKKVQSPLLGSIDFAQAYSPSQLKQEQKT